MPDIDVGCDPEKILSEDKYNEYVSERPSLNRRPGFVATSQTIIKEEEEKHTGSSNCNLNDQNEENLHLSDFDDKMILKNKDLQNYFQDETLVCRNEGQGLNQLKKS
jgi:hypothetical protein